MWQFAAENKPGFAKGTRSVTWRYTTSYVTKIYRIEVEVFAVFYRLKKLSVFWLQSLLPVGGIRGCLCAVAGTSDRRLSWGVYYACERAAQQGLGYLLELRFIGLKDSKIIRGILFQEKAVEHQVPALFGQGCIAPEPAAV